MQRTGVFIEKRAFDNSHSHHRSDIAAGRWLRENLMRRDWLQLRQAATDCGELKTDFAECGNIWKLVASVPDEL